MTKNQHAEPEITIRELLAVIIRGGRCVLALAVVLALVLGLSGLTATLGDEQEEDAEYRFALDSYNITKEQKETTLARLKKDVESQKFYLQKSLLMQVDPYNKPVTTMTFAISGIVTNGARETFTSEETPVSYMTQRIQAQYNGLWNQLDLGKLAEGTAYAGVEEKYLREVVTMSVEEGGVLLLSIIGNDAASGAKLAGAIHAALEASESAVERASYVHDFVLLHDASTKVVVDTELEKQQVEAQTKLKTDQNEILKLEEELLNLKAPAAPAGIMSVAKRAIVGGVAGAVLAMVWLVCRHLMGITVTASQKLSCDYGLTYLGNASNNRKLCYRLAQKTVREHMWKNSQSALDYVRENGISHIPENCSVAVITSLTKVDREAVENVLQALSGNGHTVAFGDDAIHNAEALAMIRKCDGVVLAESAFTSKLAEVEDVLALVQGMNKPVYGYVMV